MTLSSALQSLEFKAIYNGEKLKKVNPYGDVAVCTLWSKVDSAISVMKSAGIDLVEDSSRITVVANLYGNGLPHMLRNLLYNPQVKYILILGKNLSGSKEWLLNFFKEGLEEAIFLDAKAHRIVGTDRIIDGELNPEMFASVPEFTILGDVGSEDTKEGIKNFFSGLPNFKSCVLPRIEPPEIPKAKVARLPSSPFDGNVTRKTPVEAWKELIFRLHRFGFRNIVAKSSGVETRVELLNTKVVVENPTEESDEILKKYGFSLEKFRGYQKRIIDPVKPTDLDYTYGNRLRGYFKHWLNRDADPVDTLLICANRLKKDPESRHAYISLWDTSRDSVEGRKTPCFVTAFFRKFEGKLTMTATFRAHNAMDGWLENVYGLIAIQRFVCEKIDMEPGPITVISHSISIDPDSLVKAKGIADSRKSDDDEVDGKSVLREDPNGDFVVTHDEDTFEIVVQQFSAGNVIGEYRGKTSEEVERNIARDCSVSIISHALYLGRVIGEKEAELKILKATSKK